MKRLAELILALILVNVLGANRGHAGDNTFNSAYYLSGIVSSCVAQSYYAKHRYSFSKQNLASRLHVYRIGMGGLGILLLPYICVSLWSSRIQRRDWLNRNDHPHF